MNFDDLNLKIGQKNYDRELRWKKKITWL